MAEKQEKKVRPPGYYRVQWNDNLWTIEEWKGWYWANFKGHDVPLKHIDETPVPAEPIPMPDAERLRDALGQIANPELSDVWSRNELIRRMQHIAREALSAVGDGWVRVEEKQPELNEVIWLGWSSAHVTPGRLVEGKPWLQEEPIYISNENGHAFVPEPTHWKPYTVPLPPQPIKQKP